MNEITAESEFVDEVLDLDKISGSAFLLHGKSPSNETIQWGFGKSFTQSMSHDS